jgi:hypothetical protein
MSIFLDHPEFYNKPIRLNQEKAAGQVISDFCDDFPLSDIRHILWKWFEVAITTKNDEYSGALQRVDLLFHYKRLEELCEAAYIVNEDNKEAPQKA